jgi:fatty acid desaturase
LALLAWLALSSVLARTFHNAHHGHQEAQQQQSAPALGAARGIDWLAAFGLLAYVGFRLALF